MPTYERRLSPPVASYAPPGGSLPYPTVGGMPWPDEPMNYDMGDFTDFPPEERARLRAAAAKFNDPYDDDLAYGKLPAAPSGRKASPNGGNQHSYDPGATSPAGYQQPTTTTHASQPNYGAQYMRPESYQYTNPHENTTYTPKPQTSSARTSSSNIPIDYTRETSIPSQQFTGPPSPRLPYAPPSPRTSHAHVVEMTPGVSRQSSMGLTPRMDRLTVSGIRPEMTGALPPPSPLLEAYHGTYQSISPMPSPMMLAHDGDLDGLPSLSQLTPSAYNGKYEGGKHEKSKHESGKHHRKKSSTSGGEKYRNPSSSSHRHDKPEKKRVKLYDAEEDAKVINEALSHHRGPDGDPICDILPHLTHDQILELRNEYKRVAKIQGRGVNIAKHIKMKLTGNFGKVAYVTALGRWESEGYWANFWYQSHGSRRELLIESLMGRSNAEIRQIKDSFKDKRYGDDLIKCMEKELKADKFRVAILTALEERRQEETDIYPREYVDKDASILYKCITAPSGGESAMLDIVTRRSDAHLREVLKMYERQYRSNFARDALKKSNNLVVRIPAIKAFWQAPKTILTSFRER